MRAASLSATAPSSWQLRFPSINAASLEWPQLFTASANRFQKYERNPSKYWSDFYKRHKNKFFKDRHYLKKQWSSYFTIDDTSNEKRKVVLEVGCGAGNTIFPLVATFPNLFVHACDFSPQAVALVQAHENYRADQVNAFVCDVTADDLRNNISPSSIDVVTLIFALSSVSPGQMTFALKNIKRVLKPNGFVLLRDYAIGDFAQVMLSSKNQMISKNFYVRGDGTCVFYFSEASLLNLFKNVGFGAVEVGICSKQIENRSKKVLMDRRWIQAEFCNLFD
ncbi:tRNA N(3)-methylcytidine methyltransferase trm141-like [Aristolochia californica]|uniref:tRNA N(3)-methylcytidine methyltransferase trm141-like n=1 Tax=Aristolochia californica TaxID=171875 RepID=UPI0035E105AA